MLPLQPQPQSPQTLKPGFLSAYYCPEQET